MFQLLHHGPWVKRNAVLFAFDLLELDGHDFTREPIETRKRALAKVLRLARSSLQLVEHLEVDGPLFFAHSCKLRAGPDVSA